ncbi:LOW QUALITY PROTEIN: nesprin-3 [Sebastes umbrosus]|uniref:LOW QUALITY PROTEIN: nesprin-3 n=1 Tax=Sebastes umbrosus TaxID=72105 RepID=UPI0018A0970A|nr:LOW QUALITY PROTEIN: nesprin-3 [Sebastes umbrosus]
MTQQEEQEFMESLEAALSWMRAIQERLKANDNTQGPRDALEIRLRETEKIHQSEHEGRVKMDMALVAAENLLQSGDEELRNHTHAKLKKLKSLWEDTCTYIIHCHSRIEWVWLHWGEYLKAYEEFELWLTSRQRSLDVAVELQLGVKEKLWQVDQQRVVVSDIHGQAALLERLLDEAAALHNRTQDPSVEPQAQERLQEAYNDVRDRAEERLSLLQKIAEEHQTYQGRVQRFQSWLLSKTKELTDLMEREDTAENKLKALQALDDSVAGEEKTLQHIEGVAEAVRGNTSPSGAEMVVEEAEELRLGWQRLRQGLFETEEGLRSSLDSHSQYMARCQRLGEDIGHLRVLLQELDQELGEGREARDRTDRTEEQMVGQWRKYTGVRNTLAGEESQVELLKAQLKELFRFSEDSRHLSDDVLAVVKEHQSVKSRAKRLCSESESGLRNILQDPLLVYAQWSHMVSQVLEASSEVTDFSHIAMLVQNIERLLKGSVLLQERLSLLQVKGDLLDSVFGPERSDGMQGELSAAIRNRELLHTQLLQRKSRLQGLISRTKDFGDAYELIRSKLAALRDQLVAADGLQPDILAKKSQSDQFRVILKDLEDCEAHISALETLVSSSQSNRTQFERLYADWKHLHTAARVKVNESEGSIADHESFHDSLLNIEKWLMIMKQKLESFNSPSGQWSVEGRQLEAQRALGEFPEKELQLQQMEVQGQGVLERTSEEGQVHILRDIKRLRESWLALYNMSLNLHRLLNSSTEQTESDSWSVGGLFVDRTSLTTELSLGEGDSQGRAGGSRSQRGQQQDKPAELYGAVASSGPGRGASLEGEAGEGVMTGQGGWIQGQGEGHLILAGQDDKHLSPSRTDKDSGRSFKGDKVDSSAWSFFSGAGQKGPKDSTVDGSPDSDKSTGGGSRDRGGTALTTKVSYGEGRTTSSGEGSMEAGEGLSPEGGGAFMLFRRDPTKQTSTTTQLTMGGTGEYKSRRREFEAWLSKENELLSGICSTKGATFSAKELKIRQETLKALRSRLAWGQVQFQLLLQESQSSEAGSGPAEDVSLEELRYRWMLFKSKLKDVGDIRARASAKRVQAKQEEPAIAAKVQKKPGLLQRVCRLALPLWLLLLALLLLAFLLPLMDESSSCSLSNNFARSFNVMLRYDGPPPT